MAARYTMEETQTQLSVDCCFPQCTWAARGAPVLQVVHTFLAASVAQLGRSRATDASAVTRHFTKYPAALVLATASFGASEPLAGRERTAFRPLRALLDVGHFIPLSQQMGPPGTERLAHIWSFNRGIAVARRANLSLLPPRARRNQDALYLSLLGGRPPCCCWHNAGEGQCGPFRFPRVSLFPRPVCV